MSIKIYVDQGHNPVNPNAGAEGNGLREQDITYKVGVRHGSPVIYTVNAPKMYRDGYKFYRSVNGVWLTDRVPPEYLKR